MHEASLVQGLLDLVTQSLISYNEKHPEKPAGKIKEIICGAGLLGCFEEHTLKSCFEIFAEGTPVENAQLTIHTIPLDCICKSCNHEFQLQKRNFICPDCGSADINFKGGNGLVLEAINVECEEKNG